MKLEIKYKQKKTVDRVILVEDMFINGGLLAEKMGVSPALVSYWRKTGDIHPKYWERLRKLKVVEVTNR